MNAEQAYRQLEAALTQTLGKVAHLPHRDAVKVTKAIAEAQTALMHLKRDDKRLSAETQKAQVVAQESFFKE